MARESSRTSWRAASGAGNTAMPSTEEAAIAREVERSMKKGTALVQAAIEHLHTAEGRAEGLWDKWVQESDVSIDGYPTEVQVMTFMCKLSRTRQRMCLAQRGKRRTGDGGG